MKSKLKTILFVLTATILVTGAAWFDYHVWSLKHPEAPMWTYFVSR